jgi:hypothetical protein
MMFFFGVIRHKMGIPARSMRQMRGEPEDSRETERLRAEVGELKERIKVLERIAVEKEDTLSRQIEQLRDR